MSAASEEYEELHQLVDRLSSSQVRALHAVALELVQNTPSDGERRRTLSFAGIVADEPDLAQRSEDIIRERFRQS